MVLALLIVVAAGSLTAGIITANLSLTWISLGVAAAAFLLLLGDVMARRRRAGPHATAGPDEADEPEREEIATRYGDLAAFFRSAAESGDAMLLYLR